MGRRLEFHEVLAEVLGSRDRVYYQPPANLAMKYPCIVYKRDALGTKPANNALYSMTERWQVTSIDADPDSITPYKLAQLPMSRHDRQYASSQLNHDVFTIHF